MDENLNMDIMRRELTAAGFDVSCLARDSNGRSVFGVAGDNVQIDRAFYRGRELLRIRYVNPNGQRGTSYTYGADALVGLLRMRAANFAAQRAA